MRFDTPADGGSVMMAGEFTIEGLASDISSDVRLTAEERCRLVSSMEGRYFDDTRELRPLTGC